jgi:hypothetical protein
LPGGRSRRLEAYDDRRYPIVPEKGAARKIALFLRGIYPRTDTPKAIAKATGLSWGGVRKELHRMRARQQVETGTHGLYRAWTSVDLLPKVEAPEMMMHGLQIVAKLPPNGGRALPGAIQTTFGAMGYERTEGAKSLLKREFIHDRKVHFDIHPATATVVISVSASSAPLRTTDLDAFFAKLSGYCSAIGVELDSPNTRVARVELNADYKQFEVSGLTDVSLKAFQNAWAHLYQKHADLMRIELQVVPTSLSLAEAVEIVKGLTGPRQVWTPPAMDPNAPEVA